MIRFVNTTYTYPFQEKPAVRGVDLHVRPGELVLVTGESGCGKSTLMRLANGLCPQYFGGTLEGDVFVGGKSTGEMPLKDMSHMVGTLFQDPEQQFFALEVEDELAFVHEWRGTPAAETRRKIAEAAKEFLLEDLLGHSIHELSEGQKQKVGLASIFSQDLKALVLDEPTANLDSKNSEQILKLMKSLNKDPDLQTTFIFSTHDSRIVDMCDHVVHILDGQVINDEHKEGSDIYKI